jgi:hypothetical protein
MIVDKITIEKLAIQELTMSCTGEAQGVHISSNNNLLITTRTITQRNMT